MEVIGLSSGERERERQTEIQTPGELRAGIEYTKTGNGQKNIDKDN
jgi:hypothetical protein